jgi:hypothetical protein
MLARRARDAPSRSAMLARAALQAKGFAVYEWPW